MPNDKCPVGASNKAKIEASEKRIAELSKSVKEGFRHLEKSQQLLLEQISDLNVEFTRRLDQTLEKFSNNPSWLVMLIFSGLSSLCVGLIVYLIKVKI